MNLIIDPDHWFESVDDPSADAHEVKDPEGARGLLLPALPTQRRRKLRDAIDTGNEPESPLIIRDLADARREYPAFVARASHSTAPTLSEYYPELEPAFTEVPQSVTFSDVRQFTDLVDAPAELDSTVVADILELVVARREGSMAYPRPQTFDLHPSVIATLLGYDTIENLRERFIRDQFLEGPNLFSLPSDLSEGERRWLESLDWIQGDQYTTEGELARRYVRQLEDEQIEIEALALLERAGNHASENGDLLISNKLEDAITRLDTNDESLTDELRRNLVMFARPEAYERAIDVATEAEALRVDSVLDIESPETVLQSLQKSRPDRLNSINNGLDQVPLSLFVDSPRKHLPPAISHILSAMEPAAVGNALDSAIASGESQLDETFTQVEDIADVIGPLLTDSERAQLTQTILSARTMRNLLSPDDPTSAEDCVELYDDYIEREVELEFGFEETKQKVGDVILKACEKYIRDQYRTWVSSDRGSREVDMIVDIPDLVEERFDQYDHLVLMISDGFGLRQWLEARHTVETIQNWYDSGVASDTLMTTIFPSETGAGHYSFLTGQFPSEHGRDAINKTIDVEAVSLFEAARSADAHVQAFSYLPSYLDGFSTVMAEHADNFEHLEGMQAESAALTGKSQQAVASTIAQSDRSFSVIQHNQIDQLHEGSDHIADTLVSGVAEDIVDYISGLATGITDNVGFILTADHGMIRTRHSSQVDLTHGDAYHALQGLNERYDGSRLGQRVAGLEAKSTTRSGGIQSQTNTSEYFEVLPKQTMKELKALTNDKCSGRSLRMLHRYYSESERMTATHGAFTFDEMFIPFVEFDLANIEE